MKIEEPRESQTCLNQRAKRIPRVRKALTQLQVLRRFGPRLLGLPLAGMEKRVTHTSGTPCYAKFHEMATLVEVAKSRREVPPKASGNVSTEKSQGDVWAVPVCERSDIPTGEVSVKL